MKANEPIAKMASEDPREDRRNLGDQMAGQMVPYRGDATSMELKGTMGGVMDSQHGERENHPEPLWLQDLETVAAEAAWRATL